MPDSLSDRYAELLTGSYDCVDRIVLNAFFRMGHGPGGFRVWWRALTGSEETLDNTHLMRMAGRFSRRIHGYAKANGIPVVHCPAGERKHELAEEYLITIRSGDQCPSTTAIRLHFCLLPSYFCLVLVRSAGTGYSPRFP